MTFAAVAESQDLPHGERFGGECAGLPGELHRLGDPVVPRIQQQGAGGTQRGGGPEPFRDVTIQGHLAGRLDEFIVSAGGHQLPGQGEA